MIKYNANAIPKIEKRIRKFFVKGISNCMVAISNKINIVIKSLIK